MINKKKKYFKQKLEGVQKMAWDLEFKKFKLQELKEEIRNQYDRTKEDIHAITLQIENPEHKPETKKILEDRREAKEKDLKQFEQQMTALEIEISGSQPTKDLPDGHTGVEQQIDGLRDLKKMLEDFIKYNV